MKCMCVGGLSAFGLQPLGFQDRKSPGFPSDSKESGSSFVHLVDLHVGLSQLCLGYGIDESCWRLGLKYPHLLQGHPNRGPTHAKAQIIVSRATRALQLQLRKKRFKTGPRALHRQITWPFMPQFLHLQAE